MKMWVLIMITYAFNPNVPHTHFKRLVGNQYYYTEEQCLRFRDSVLFDTPKTNYLAHIECRPAPYDPKLIMQGATSLYPQSETNHLIYWK